MNLYINQNLSPRGSLVISQTNPTAIPVRDFVFGNVINTNLYLADGLGDYDDHSGDDTYSLRVGIGLPGSAPVWVNTNWTAFDNSGVKGWNGVISTNTDAIQDLFTTLGSNPINCELEITIFDSAGNAITSPITPIKIWNRVAPDGAVEVAPSPNNIDGEFPIPLGADALHVRGLGLSLVPRRVQIGVRKSAGADLIFASVVVGSITADGFDVDLSAITQASTYVLDYYLYF